MPPQSDFNSQTTWQCVVDHCCAQFTACASSAQCATVLSCWNACTAADYHGGGTCKGQCEADAGTEAGTSGFETAFNCMVPTCTSY